MKVKEYPGRSSLVTSIDGHWLSSEVYTLPTPDGLVVGYYNDDSYLSLRFVLQGVLYTRWYEEVKTKRHAATLTKRFYYDIRNAVYNGVVINAQE